MVQADTFPPTDRAAAEPPADGTISPRRPRITPPVRVRWVVWVPTGAAPRWAFPSRRVACDPGGIALLEVSAAARDLPAACPRS